MEDRFEPDFEYWDKWAQSCSIPKLKDEDFNAFGKAFDEKQRDIHVSDSSVTRMIMMSQHNLVSLNEQWFLSFILSSFGERYMVQCSHCMSSTTKLYVQ